METIDELEQYLHDECYNFNFLTIGRHHAPEGIVIEKQENRFIFAYSERGKKTILKSFELEKELVKYALKELQRDKWCRGHLAAWTWNEKDIAEAEKELKILNIPFERNDISNYTEGKRVYRIFVFGKDILKLAAFQKKYCKDR